MASKQWRHAELRPPCQKINLIGDFREFKLARLGNQSLRFGTINVSMIIDIWTFKDRAICAFKDQPVRRVKQSDILWEIYYNLVGIFINQLTFRIVNL